jgi:predicted nucleic acid-binding protein
MKLVISDTNIFIDLINIDLLDDFLKLEYEFHTTDFVLNEISDEQNKILAQKVEENKIVIDKAEADELSEIIELQSKKKALSIIDFSVYYFAKKQNGMILAGDKSFRTYATEQQIEVKGILWILDEILDKKILEENKMIEKLNLLTTTNKRLPKEECDKRLKKWGARIE